jgi:CLIP-associating protein 1/2
MMQTVAAVEGIAEVFCAQLEPVYGLGALRSSLATFLDQAPSTTVASAFALGLRLMGRYFSRLPMEVLEDELPKAKDLIQTVRSLRPAL